MPYQLKITLQDVTPPIWRRVIVSGGLTLLDLHHVIQIVMGWEDSHLHDFTINRQRYALPHEDDVDNPRDESTTALCDVLKARSKFEYQYDFGDGWHHMIQVEKAVVDTEIVPPKCIDGARACPPEDSGGPWGYVEKLEALKSPNNSETDYLREWIGDFDPELFDLGVINESLKRLCRSTPTARDVSDNTLLRSSRSHLGDSRRRTKRRDH